MTVPAPGLVVADVEAAGQRLVHAGHRDPGEVLRRAGLEVYRRLGSALRAGGPVGDADLVALGAVHERLLEHMPSMVRGRFRLATGSAARKASGSYFTPLPLVEHLLDLALEPALDELGDPLAVRVLDPACGSGLFLALAARRIARRLPGDAAASLRAAQGCLTGVDADPLAVELARICLTPGAEVAHRSGRPRPRLVVADALLDGAVPESAFHVVVGNPPFGNQLGQLTARSRDVHRRLKSRAGDALAAYTDVSAVFLHRAVGWARDGGWVGFVQPQSLLAARDAAGVRREVADSCALESLWSSDTPLFAARVVTCAPVLRKGATQGVVRRTHGPRFEDLAGVDGVDLAREWSPLLAGALGVPPVAVGSDTGRLGDLAACTADFRDQYYGLAPYVHEAADCPDGAPLVTAGLIDPGCCHWGERPTRFRKQRWQAPVVDLDGLGGDPALAAWAQRRRVPKVLVATQGRVVEAVVDPTGEWLPSVPTITVVPHEEDRLWHLLAVLLAPPVSAYAAGRYAGTALSTHAVKLSARQAADLPLPANRSAWNQGARLAAAAQAAGGLDLAQLGRVMCDAYQSSGDVLKWWLGRLETQGPNLPKVKISAR